MEKIVWTDEYSVGDKVLDNQHKQIIDAINKLIEQQDSADSQSISAEIIGEIKTYASEHFDLEEQMMKEHGFPDYEHHRTQHRAFKIKTAQLRAAKKNSISGVSDMLLKYLCDWLKRHILHEDMKYRTFFSDKGILK